MSRSGDQQGVTLSPDDLTAAVLAHEASLPDGGGTGYALPPALAEHVMSELPDWDGQEGYEAWRRDQDERWEHGGRQAAAREFLSPPLCPPPPA